MGSLRSKRRQSPGTIFVSDSQKVALSLREQYAELRTAQNVREPMYSSAPKRPQESNATASSAQQSRPPALWSPTFSGPDAIGSWAHPGLKVSRLVLHINKSGATEADRERL